MKGKENNRQKLLNKLDRVATYYIWWSADNPEKAAKLQHLSIVIALMVSCIATLFISLHFASVAVFGAVLSAMVIALFTWCLKVE